MGTCRPFQAKVRNWHITSPAFCWTKKVTMPAQIQGERKQVSLLDGKTILQDHIAKGMDMARGWKDSPSTTNLSPPLQHQISHQVLLDSTSWIFVVSVSPHYHCLHLDIYHFCLDLDNSLQAGLPPSFWVPISVMTHSVARMTLQNPKDDLDPVMKTF